MIWQSYKVSVQAHAQLHLQFLSSDSSCSGLSHTGIYNTNETAFFQKQWHFEKTNMNVFFWDCYCKCCQNSSFVCMFGICVLLAVNCLLLFYGNLSRDTL